MALRAGDPTKAARRPYDAAASREALLRAARAVFEEVGYDRATTRQIGERAGVDPSLIARYFESKEGLFLAALEAGPAGDGLDLEPGALLAQLLEYWEERGYSPISRALASPALSEEARERVHNLMRERVAAPVGSALEERGVARALLRAELLVALAVGVSITRANGTLGELAAAPRDDVLALLAPAVEAIAGEVPSHGD
jgi:AcrR family transcriptional regulator